MDYKMPVSVIAPWLLLIFHLLTRPVGLYCFRICSKICLYFY